MRKYLLLLLMVFSIQPLQAKTVYIQDVIYVPLRGGASDQHRIINRGVRSGTAMELISEDPDSGFSQIRMRDGTEGWLKTQYISEEKIARDRIGNIKDQLSKSEQENSRLQENIDELQSAEARLTAENNALIQQNEQTQTELDELKVLSADVINMVEKNRYLSERNTLLLDELDTLSQANSNLISKKDQRWFAFGALTILIGMLPGFWFARKIYNRRSSGWA